ncbi:MAG: hypothetical protein OXG17_07120 [Chloroflexi bacterium]|nr:hypothetical protein [Chloroflexota bacterium]
MNADLIPLLVASILSAAVVFLGLGGLNVVLWRNIRAEVRLLSNRIDAASDGEAETDECLAAVD